MLVNLNVPWVILGHSERRLLLKESNEVKFCIHNVTLTSNWLTKGFYLKESSNLLTKVSHPNGLGVITTMLRLL
jgi:hypothetical protein